MKLKTLKLKILRLEATYEEASQVEESKMSMLVHDHKLPQIEKDE